MSLLESTRIQCNEDSSENVEYLDNDSEKTLGGKSSREGMESLDLSAIDKRTEDKIEDSESISIDSLKDEIQQKQETIHDKNTHINELKSLVSSLMTQLLRMGETEKQLSLVKRQLAEKEEDLKVERRNSESYKEALNEVKRILNQDIDEIEIPESYKKSKKVDSKVENKKVTFKDAPDIKEFSPKSTEEHLILPLCRYYSMLGDCPLLPAGRCHWRHSGNICFQFQRKGHCSWNDKCKYRHPVEYRVLRKRQRTYMPQRKKWVPQKAPRSSWRKPNCQPAFSKSQESYSNSTSSSSVSSTAGDSKESFTGLVELGTSALGGRSGLSSNMESGGLSPTGRITDELP